MKEFNYDLDYKNIDFSLEENRKLYRIGRGEQGVLLVRPYTNDICAHWRFKTPEIAVESANKILSMYLEYMVGRFYCNFWSSKFPMSTYIVSIRPNQ